MTIKPIKLSVIDRKVSRTSKNSGMRNRVRRQDRVDGAVTLVEVYEQKRFRIAPPDPVDAIKFRMDQLGSKRPISRKSSADETGPRGC
jgi:HTH-type transcriptional regulator/antitoxin HigA